jgi:outer membrane protein TolC
MYSCMLKRFIMGCICTLYLPGVLCAATSDSSWEFWLQNQIGQHPEVIAAKERMNAVISMSEGRERPLYNPELETEYEREGEDNNYRIGVNQTIDLWDKRGARKQQARFTRSAAQQAFALVLQQKTAEAMQALIEWQAVSQQAELAQKQESHMDTLLNLVKERQLAGDLGQLDAELTYFSLSQRLKETAQTLAGLRKAEARLRELLPDWSPERAQIPAEFWSADNINQTPADQWQDDYPAVMAAKAEWDALQQGSELARREAKADPTFGINAGESGEESVVGLTFSIPLHFRNNFSSEVQAASQNAASAKAQYRATRRKQQFAIAAAQAALQEYQQRFERWQNLMQGRGERSGQLLEKQWRSGDMSTTEYLLAMQQRSEGLIAGIELRTLFHSARVDWLLQTGQLNTTLIIVSNHN